MLIHLTKMNIQQEFPLLIFRVTLKYQILIQAFLISMGIKVIWISPRQQGSKPQGFAIQLGGEKGLAFKNEAEKMLAGHLTSDKPTYTL